MRSSGAETAQRNGDGGRRVAVVGAGSSGIATTKVLHERGLDVTCFEAGDRVGGNWVFGNKNGMSSAYRSLYINTSRDRMAYSDFPMPASYPDFPHHSQIADYFDAYVDHFGFRDRIRFETGVRRIEPVDASGKAGFDLTLDDGTKERFAAVCIANGHHWDPAWPDPPIPGVFSNRLMHSHDYKEPSILDDQRVVVLGMGNSAMDIAVDSSHRARRTVLAARRGAHIVPKYLFGRPIDQFATVGRWLPVKLRAKLVQKAVELVHGKPEDYGLPKPDHELGEAHPTISSRILDRIAHGKIAIKPTIERFDGDTVRFADGTEEVADLVILSTGYKVTFPFFDPSFIDAKDNDLPLYRRVFHPEVHNLFFIGLLQPLGAIMPLAERQSIWVAEYLQGKYALPSRADMAADMEREREAMFSRYVKSRRHTMQVDFDEYLEAIDEERRQGRMRARVSTSV